MIARKNYSSNKLVPPSRRGFPKSHVLIFLVFLCAHVNPAVEGYLCAYGKRKSRSLRELQLSSSVAEKDDVWTSRRKIIRSTMKPLAKDKMQKRLQNIIDGVDLVSDESEAEKKPAGLLVTAFLVATSALVLRVGGRSAFVSVLGLDFVADSGIKSQVDEFVNNFQSMDATERYGSFFLAWLAAKAFCLDPFTIVLAFSSGILFGGILEGNM